MKKSVLFALLGVTSVEGLRINQREAQTASVDASVEEAPVNGSNASLAEPTPVNGSAQALAVNGTNVTVLAEPSNGSNSTFAQNASNVTAAFHQGDNASNATAFVQGDNASNATAAVQYDFVRALVDIDDKQQDMDHEAEMAQVDKEAEEQVKKQHHDSDDDDNLAGLDADIQDDSKDCKIEPKKNKDSSDEECACAPHKLTEKDKSKIKAKQAKKTADAKAAKEAAEKAREAAEEAIAAANLAKRTSAKNVLELAKKAEEAIA